MKHNENQKRKRDDVKSSHNFQTIEYWLDIPSQANRDVYRVIYRGKLKAWKADRGFGFIQPDDGGKDVFVHVRDFGKISRSPKAGDTVKYQLIKDNTGKVRAANAQIDGLTRLSPPPHPRKSKALVSKTADYSMIAKILIGLVFGLVIITAISINRASVQDNVTHLPSRSENQTTTRQYRCEGKEHCSQMRSCDEAKFYISHCPNTKMDGDRDGIPCEQQLC